jgi:hypothetical protein
MGNPQDDKLRMKVLKMIEFGDVAEIWKSQALDEQQIKKTIASIEASEIPEMSELDNHAAFITALNDYRKSDKFARLGDYGKGLVIFCIEWHVTALNNLLNPQLAQQQLQAEAAIKMAPQMAAKTQAMIDQLHPGSPANAGGGQPPGQPPAAIINAQGNQTSNLPPQAPNQQPPMQ